jgi:hypothetical protein
VVDVIKWLITSCINTLPNTSRLGVAAQVICVATVVSNERGFSDMKLHMTRLRSSLGVEMLEHLMRISIEGPAIGTPECENLLERALNHWSGLKERRMDRDWEVPNKLVVARRARHIKQNAWKKERLNAEKAEDLRKKGFSGMSRHAITRHEDREARKKAAATKSAEAEATIAADYDAAIADEAIDKRALEAMALVKAEHGTKEAEN